MKGKAARILRQAVRRLGGKKPHGYEVVPHTVRHKEHREPWQTKDELPKFAYTTATLRLVPSCDRARYQRAKRLFKIMRAA